MVKVGILKRRYFIAGIITGILLFLSHNIWLGGRHNNVLYFHLFSIILILGYLFSLKLTSYLADFKNIENQSRIEIIFLAIFFVMLFIPMSHIKKDKISGLENRTLAKWHPLIKKDGKLNLNFGKDYDNWFNDRFALRFELVNLANFPRAANKLVRTGDGSIYDKQNRLMYTGYHLTYKIDDKETDAAIKNLDLFDKFCKDNNISLYVLIVPYSADINYENVPYIDKAQKIENQKIIKKIQSKTVANVIYPLEKLQKLQKSDYAYFKTEHHWTDTGAYTGYRDLMNAIQKDYPDIKAVKLEDYNKSYSKMVRADFSREYDIGQTFQHNFHFLKAFDKKILTTEYPYYEHKNKNLLDLQVVDIPYHKGKITYYPQGNDLRAIEIGSSMNENLLGFTQYTFKNLKYIRTNTPKSIDENDAYKIIKYYKKEILDYKPDIIIFCITPSNINSLKDLFKEN